ncbi:MAG TPA: glycoside hydrolase family 3 N-terminal domain-containing protein [Microbacterium sp.]|nr:glycoside hydrolase family 3 N-terminal domain-containing protein [Microbacterium sp.]
MDAEKLVPGVLLPGFAGPALPEWVRAELERGLAGVCLFAGNIDHGDPHGVRRLSDAIRAIEPHAIVAADEEGGVVTRLEADTGSTLPSPAQLGLVPPEVAERVGSVLAARARRSGIGLLLAPVADVNDNPANPVIGARSFGAAPRAVADRVAAQVRGIRSRRGVAACVKHWPGHGDTDVDSHRGLPVISAATAERHAAPFETAIDAGVDAVMTAHIVVPEWGEHPVTVNPAAIARLRAAGFDGVVVTDAVDMAAIADTYGLGRGAARALAAGADLVCIGNPGLSGADAARQYGEAVEAIVDAVGSGLLDPARLREAQERVARLGARIAAGPDADPPGEEQAEALDEKDLSAIADALAAASAPDALAALPLVGRVVDARPGTTQAAATRTTPVPDALRALAGPGAVTAVVVDRPAAAQLAAIERASADGESIVVNVGAIPGGFDAAVSSRTVHLGADSAFSAAVLGTWVRGDGRS